MSNNTALAKIAKSQYGYFSARQALAAGYSTALHTYHVKHKNWIKINRGVYRLPGFDDCSESEFTCWTIWTTGRSPKRNPVISHNSALYNYGLIPDCPERIHLSISTTDTVRAGADKIILHHANLTPSEILQRQGYRITSARRTLMDMKSDLILDRNWVETVLFAHQKNLIHQNEAEALLYDIPNIFVRSDWGCNAKGDIMTEHRNPSVVVNGENSLGTLLPQRFSLREKFIRKNVPGGRSGFTLVELLVVMAIISILASLLMPILHKSMEAAKNISCINNMKQRSLSFSSYTNDYLGWFPGCLWQSDLRNGGYEVIDIQRRIAQCPIGPSVTDDGYLCSSHYAYTGVYYSETNTYFTNAIKKYHTKISQIKKNSQKIYLTEYWISTANNTIYTNILNDKCIRVTHHGGTNLLYADNHVEHKVIGLALYDAAQNFPNLYSYRPRDNR